MSYFLLFVQKGNTPLHFASENGHEEVLEVLLAQPATNYNVRNRDQKTPAEVVCERWRGSGSCEATKKKILDLLEGEKLFA